MLGMVDAKTVLLLSAIVVTAWSHRPERERGQVTSINVLGPSAHLQLSQDKVTPSQGGPGGGYQKAVNGRKPEIPTAGGDDGKSKSSVAASPTNRRTNMCTRLAEVTEGKRSLLDGLDKAHITAVAPMPGNSYIYKDEDGHWYGYDYEVLKALAERAKFDFDIIEEHYDHPKLGKSSTSGSQKSASVARLAEAVDARQLELSNKFDIVMSHNGESYRRESKKEFPVFDQLDSSLVLVTSRDPVKNESLLHGLCKLTAPYDPWVWLVFFATTAATGCLFVLLERPAIEAEMEKPDAEKVTPDSEDYYWQRETVPVAVYTTFMHCTTIANLSPRTWPGRIVVMTWSAMSIIFLAGYTANLATILVMEQQASQQWKDINEVTLDEAKICVRAGSSAHSYMSDLFPSYSHTIVTEGYPLDTMVKGECDAAIIWQMNFEVAQLQQKYNHDCKLDRVGEKLTTSFGGWSALADYKDRCTVLIKDVLHLHMQAMEEDGTLEKLYTQKLLKAETTRKTSCSTQEKGIYDVSLKLQSVMGLFIFHSLGAILALGIFVCGRNASDAAQTDG